MSNFCIFFLVTSNGKSIKIDKGIYIMKQNIIIGIGGGTASGKTTLADSLSSDFAGKGTVLLRLDDYYRDRSHLSVEERKTINYDTPDAFDIELIVTHLEALKQNKAIECPSYDFSHHCRKPIIRHLSPQPVILLEGIMALAIPEVRNLIDFKIFVDTPADVRLLRRISRDINHRGRTLEEVSTQYLSTVRPMHDLYVEPSKIYADVIIPEGGYNQVALGLLSNYIRQIIAGNE